MSKPRERFFKLCVLYEQIVNCQSYCNSDISHLLSIILVRKSDRIKSVKAPVGTEIDFPPRFCIISAHSASLSTDRPVQVNLFHRHLFSYQLTHNMTADCSLNHQFSNGNSSAEHVVYTNCFSVMIFRTIYVHNMF